MKKVKNAVLLMLLPWAAAGQYREVKKEHKDTAVAEVRLMPVPKMAAKLVPGYYTTLGAACKIEYKLEKASGVPLRLRLGSLQYTDYMERKPNAQSPVMR